MNPWQITWLVVSHTLLSLVLFAGLVGLIVFVVRNRVRKFKPVEMQVFDLLEKRVSLRRNRAMQVITFLGTHRFLIPANLALIGYFIFIARQDWFSIRVITIALSSLVLMIVLKRLFQRKRPLSPLLSAAKGLSFPSGHAIMAVTFYGLILYIISKTGLPDPARWLAVVFLPLLMLAIGYSRVYLRVHYPSDVIAGFIIGLLWLMISLIVLNKLENLVHPDHTTLSMNVWKCLYSKSNESYSLLELS